MCYKPFGFGFLASLTPRKDYASGHDAHSGSNSEMAPMETESRVCSRLQEPMACISECPVAETAVVLVALHIQTDGLRV